MRTIKSNEQNSKSGRALRTQMVTFYMVASLSAILLIGFILYYSISGIVLEDALSTTTMAVEKSGDTLEVYIDKVKDLSLILAEAPSTRAYLSEKDNITIKEQVGGLIKTALSSDPYIASIIIVGKEGQLISNEASLDMSMSEDMMKESWYVDAVDSGDMPSLTSARMQKFNMDKDNWVISMSREIKNEDGEHLGVIVIDFKYSVVEAYLSNLDLGLFGYIYILNSNGGVVYHEDTTYFENEEKQKDLVAMSHMEGGYNASMNRLVHQHALDGTDWVLTGVASLDGLSAIRRQLIETILLVSLMTFGALVVISTYVSGRITRPIRQLEKAMADIDQGLSSIELDEQSSREAMSLATHYNDMIHTIKRLMTDVGDQEKAIRAYELNVLHSQINPHFLYNTLDTIVWMAEFGDSEKVIYMTKALARFFRLSLSGGSETTTIGDELDHVRQYLKIQKERYEDKLSYTIEETEALNGIVIPKIILQPLVENSIYHGIRPKKSPGHVWISVEEDGEDVLLIVRDDGIGYDQSKTPSAINENEPRLGGVGIKNVNQRLALTFGQNYGLKVISKVGEGTISTLRLGRHMDVQKK